MPPTLIASIYGMNFKAMPELDWGFGYPRRAVLDGRFRHRAISLFQAPRLALDNKRRRFMTSELLEERDGGIVTLVINRPAKLNAMTKPLWGFLGETVRRLDADDTVRCIVLRGAGGKAFSPGNDIAEFTTERSNAEQARAYGKIMHGTLDALASCRHPLVALIEGICVGGGLEIAALCDLRICGREQPLWRADQSARPGHGLCRDGGAAQSGRPAPSPWRSCSKAASSAPPRPRRKGW